MARIYTKTGDKGETGLVGANGCLNPPRPLRPMAPWMSSTPWWGWLGDCCQDKRLALIDGDLATVQHWLFDLGSLLACAPADRAQFKLRPLTDAHAQWMEKRMDVATAEPALKTSSCPGGSGGRGATPSPAPYVAGRSVFLRDELGAAP